MFDLAELQRRLEEWAVAHVRGGARIAHLRPMPGHSGLSYGFDVTGEDGEAPRALVIRLAPPGVRRSGNTDVLRQVPLLGALSTSGIPVAPLVWSTGDPAWFGTDAIVQERLDAEPLSARNLDVASCLRRSVDVLVAIHAVDWRRLLPEWGPQRTATEEVAFWEPLLSKHPDAGWAEAGHRLAEDLRRTDPGSHRIGLVHGDFQPSNILVEGRDGSVAAVIDWEIAGIGPTGLDLGWLAMMTDPLSWHPEARAAFPVIAGQRELCDQYAAAAGSPVPHVDWYQALACYRFGAIVGFNVRLHRTGRRPDPLYEVLASSAPVLFGRGQQLLGDGGS